MSNESLFENGDLSIINESQKIRNEILTTLVKKGYDNEENVKTVLMVLKDMDSSVYTKVRLKTIDKSSDALKDMAANSANILLRLRDVINENPTDGVTAPVIPDEQSFKNVPGIDKIGQTHDSFTEFMANMEADS